MIKAFERFYPKQEWVTRTFNIDSSLYDRLKYISENEINTSISRLIDACVDNFNIEGDRIVYYKKPSDEAGTKYSLRLRQCMWKKLEDMKKDYDISINRLLNMAIKYTLDED